MDDEDLDDIDPTKVEPYTVLEVLRIANEFTRLVSATAPGVGVEQQRVPPLYRYVFTDKAGQTRVSQVHAEDDMDAFIKATRVLQFRQKEGR